MLNPAYAFAKVQEVFNEYQPSRELSLAKTKLEECEMWLAKCHPTKEAVYRDQRSPDAETLSLRNRVSIVNDPDT